jgi:hypothetical protein
MNIDLADMRAAAARVADRYEATLVAEQAALAAEIAWAKENKQALAGPYWHPAHVAGLKAKAARAMADAIAEVSAEA